MIIMWIAINEKVFSLFICVSGIGLTSNACVARELVDCLLFVCKGSHFVPSDQ